MYFRIKVKNQFRPSYGKIIRPPPVLIKCKKIDIFMIETVLDRTKLKTSVSKFVRTKYCRVRIVRTSRSSNQDWARLVINSRTPRVRVVKTRLHSFFFFSSTLSVHFFFFFVSKRNNFFFFFF